MYRPWAVSTASMKECYENSQRIQIERETSF